MQNYLRQIKIIPPISIIISLFVFLIYFFNGFNIVDNNLYDKFMTLKISKEANHNIIIIEVDSKSLKKLGRWPWSRNIHANLIKKIAEKKPKVIGINILFSEPTSQDNEFVDVLKRLKNVVIAYVNEKDSIIFPIPRITETTILADVTVVKDNDGTIRSAYKDSVYLPQYSSFATAVSELFKHGVKSTIPPKKFYINFINLTKSFCHYSYSDVLLGKININSFKDKIILIGITAEGSSNIFNIPISNRLEPSLSGIELQAHIINTIISKKYINIVNNTYVFFLLLLTIIILSILLKLKKPLIQGIIVLSFCILSLLVSYLLFNYFLLWLPPAVFLITSLFLYLLSVTSTLFKIGKTVDKAITQLAVDSYVPLPDITNQIEKGILTLTELSQVINKDRQMIKAILDAINSPVLVIDNNANIIWKNKQVELIESLNKITNLSDLKIDFNFLKKQVSLENYYKQEVELGDKEYLFITTQSGEDRSNYVCIFNDITELKMLDKLKTDLIRTVSHEIRTPLTVIQSYCDLAAETGDGNLALQYLNKISLKTEELTALVTNFLDLNKLEANMIDLNLGSINILQLIESVCAEMKELADKKNTILLLCFDPKSNITILGDYFRLKQVFVNLLSNSIKYSDENKTIKLYVEKEGNKIKVTISDEGFGMTSDEVNKVFEKFYRVQTNRTKEISGTGLGLAIVKKIIDLHKGTIEVSSTPNVGTTFNIYLPQ